MYLYIYHIYLYHIYMYIFCIFGIFFYFFPGASISPFSADHPISITPSYKPFGRGPTSRSLGDNNDHHDYEPLKQTGSPVPSSMPRDQSIKTPTEPKTNSHFYADRISLSGFPTPLQNPLIPAGRFNVLSLSDVHQAVTTEGSTIALVQLAWVDHKEWNE